MVRCVPIHTIFVTCIEADFTCTVVIRAKKSVFIFMLTSSFVYIATQT